MTKRTALLAAAILVVAAIPGVATATPPHPSDNSHKVTICHVTNSAAKPYVAITVDVAAFDGEVDGVAMTDHKHHESTDGRVDMEAQNGLCPDDEDWDDGTGGGGIDDGGDYG